MSTPPGLPGWFDWITVAAIVLGPILALWIQRWLDSLRQEKQRKFQLFETLMTTLATPFNPAYVNALNAIDVVFHRDSRVREARRKLVDHLNTNTEKPDWADRMNDLKIELYRLIGSRMGYDLDTDYLKRQIYLPRRFVDVEEGQEQLRLALLKTLTDNGLRVVIADQTAPVPTTLFEPPEKK